MAKCANEAINESKRGRKVFKKGDEKLFVGSAMHILVSWPHLGIIWGAKIIVT